MSKTEYDVFTELASFLRVRFGVAVALLYINIRIWDSENVVTFVTYMQAMNVPESTFIVT